MVWDLFEHAKHAIARDSAAGVEVAALRATRCVRTPGCARDAVLDKPALSQVHGRAGRR